MSGGLKSLLPKLVAATPGLPGHHIETSERHRLDTTLSRDEQAREFNHFNKRFRNKKTLYKYLVEKTVSPRRPPL